MGAALEPFELAIHIEPADIDELGHANNVSYIRWVQEVAVTHWRTFAPAAELERLVWVVLHHEIDYKRPAFLGDQVIARTWVGSATGLRFERFTELIRTTDQTLLAKARTVWCPLDARSGKPTAVSPEVRSRFSTASPERAEISADKM